jgi:lipopolysaccharide transport system permease protein
MTVTQPSKQARLNIPIFTLYNRRELLWAWTIRTIQARYKQSFLGGLWAIVQPAARAALFTIIFTRIVPIDTGEIPYIVFSYTAMVPWTLFSSSLSDMVDSLVSNMNLVTKIYFPREILPIASLLARLIDFFIAGVLLIVLMIFFGMPLFTLNWLFLPLILAIQLALSIGLGLISSALNVFYRDIRHLVIFGVQLWLYATPIIYPVERIPPEYHQLYFLNPMAGIIESYRSVILHQQTPDNYLILSGVMAGIILVAGYWFFKRLEFQFADVV